MTEGARIRALIAKWREEAARHKKHGDCYRVGQGWGLEQSADDLESLLSREDAPRLGALALCPHCHGRNLNAPTAAIRCCLTCGVDITPERWVREDAPQMPTCHWAQDNDPDDGRYWDTQCGEAYMLIDGTLDENRHRHCPFCGARIVTKLSQLATQEGSPQ